MIGFCLGKMARGWFLLLALFVFQLAAPVFAEEFPLRGKYSDVPTISTDELAKIFTTSIVVDVRSFLEFDVIHMVGAKHIPLARLSIATLEKVRTLNGDKLMVFYCNGITCSKSYKATRKAMDLGFNNVRAYDAGIETWAKTVPDNTIILGIKQNPNRIKVQLIPKEEFLAVSIPPEEFIKKISTGNYFVVDVREDDQRKDAPIEVSGIESIPLTQFLFKLALGGKIPIKNILILDNVGKQTRWLQYHLKKHGLKDYFFLKGGVKKWQEDGFDLRGKKSH